MSHKESTNAGLVLLKGRKSYVWFSVFYAFWAGSQIWYLATPHRFQSSIWPWTNWLEIAIVGYCVWIFYEFFTALSNRIEKLICLLTMIVFALGIPAYLDELGFSWAHVWGNRRISAALLTVAALLMFFRTFQVFSRHEAQV